MYSKNLIYSLEINIQSCYVVFRNFMPLVKIQYSPGINLDSFDELSDQVSNEVSSILNKSIDYVMVIFDKVIFNHLVETQAISLYIEVKNVGELSADITKKLSESLTRLFSNMSDIDPKRIYIEFSRVGVICGVGMEIFCVKTLFFQQMNR